jgi:hypothetical protein
MTNTSTADRDERIKKVLTAGAAVLATGLVLVLPPIVNKQLQASLSLLQKPVIEFVVVLAVAAFAVWNRRVAAVLTVVLVLFGGVQVAYYLTTTSDFRAARAASEAWSDVPVAPEPSGSAENEPNALGSAKEEWSGRSITITLRSNTGVTQQGFNLDAGQADSSYFFSARFDKIDGDVDSTCPLLFGIQDIRNYYTFRVEQTSVGDYIAHVFQTIANPGENSGFNRVTLDKSAPLPYVKHWDLFHMSNSQSVDLAIKADGDHYEFYVEHRQVFSRPIEGNPPRVVAVGATTEGRGNMANTMCRFTEETLRVDRN